MTKTILVSLAVLTLASSAALAAKNKKPAAAAPAAPVVGASPVFWTGGPTAADHALYVRNLHDSGLKR